jgi:hypothetical protein
LIAVPFSFCSYFVTRFLRAVDCPRYLRHHITQFAADFWLDLSIILVVFYYDSELFDVSTTASTYSRTHKPFLSFLDGLKISFQLTSKLRNGVIKRYHREPADLKRLSAGVQAL